MSLAKNEADDQQAAILDAIIRVQEKNRRPRARIEEFVTEGQAVMYNDYACRRAGELSNQYIEKLMREDTGVVIELLDGYGMTSLVEWKNTGVRREDCRDLRKV